MSITSPDLTQLLTNPEANYCLKLVKGTNKHKDKRLRVSGTDKLTSNKRRCDMYDCKRPPGAIAGVIARHASAHDTVHASASGGHLSGLPGTAHVRAHRAGRSLEPDTSWDR